MGVGITDHPIFFTHFAVPATSSYFDAGATAKLLLRHQDAGSASAPPHIDDHRWVAVLELGTDFNQARFIDAETLAEHLRVRDNTMLCEMVFLFNCPLLPDNRVTQAGPSYVRPPVAMQQSPITADEWTEIEALREFLKGDMLPR